MECTWVSDKLYEYIYDEIDEQEKQEIERHLHECPSCQNQYEKLKKLLVDDAAMLLEFRETIEVPADLRYRVKSSLSRKARMNPLKYVLAACLMLSLFFTTPVFAYYVTQIPAIEKYVDIDDGSIADFQEGRGQLVGKSDTLKGITFTIDGIVPKEDRATILFTIKVPKDENTNFALPSSSFSSFTVTDQFGYKYRVSSGGGSVKSVNENGEATFIYDIEPGLHFWSYKLHVRLTALELGYYDGKEWVPTDEKYAYGNWNVSFYIKRPFGRR